MLVSVAGGVYLWIVALLAPCSPSREAVEILGTSWYEWSPTTRRHLLAMDAHIAADATPLFVHRTDHAYPWTYEAPVPLEQGTPLWEHVEALSHEFYELELPPEGIAFLCRLFDGGIRPQVVRFLLAALPSQLTRRHPRSEAHNLPIQPVDPPKSAFPLHSDLFRQALLLTVFHRVPAEETGGSTFLTTEALLRVLGEVPAMPASVAARVRVFFEDRDVDYFDQLVDVLYHPRHPWAAEVSRRLLAAQHRTQFAGGEGYVLNDRQWLHGREPQRCRVEPDRLCRIVWDSASTIERTPITLSALG